MRTKTVVVSGASGWMGKSAAHAAIELFGGDLNLSLISRSAKQIKVRGLEIETSSLGKAVGGPTADVYIPTNFVTREFFHALGEQRFIDENVRIVDKAVRAARELRPRGIILVSSGVISEPPKASKDASYSVYRELKIYELEQLQKVSSELGATLVEGRLFSATGRYMKSPELFAFGSIVRQAKQGEVKLTSSREVWRKYLDAVDFMKVCILLAVSGKSQTIESGGTLVELHELASLCLATLGHSPDSVFRNMSRAQPDKYFSPSDSFEEIATEFGVSLMSLEEQILQLAPRV